MVASILVDSTYNQGPISQSCKEGNLLNTGKFCLAKTGYQSKYHVKYTLRDCFPGNFCLVNKFVKQYFLHSSSMKLGPGLCFIALLTVSRKYVLR